MWKLTIVLLAMSGVALASAPIPNLPAPVDAILHAQPFELGQGFENHWRAEGGLVRQGWLVVLQVDPSLVYPRQIAEPVLYVGEETAIRLNVGYPSGRVVALVPGKGGLEPAFFGTPRLPETVTAQIIATQIESALQAHGGAALKYTVAAERLGLPDHAALLEVAAELVREHSPEEVELAEQLATQR